MYCYIGGIEGDDLIESVLKIFGSLFRKAGYDVGIYQEISRLFRRPESLSYILYAV